MELNCNFIHMAGGLIQLVATGIQDLYLTSDAQITFFKVLYRRHTNFSVESIQQDFTTKANFGQTVNCSFSKIGDLIHRIFVFIEIPIIPKFVNPDTGEEDNVKKFSWVHNLGYSILQEMYIEIGGKIIDKQYGEWLFIWSQVSGRAPIALDKMIGNLPIIYEYSNGKPGYQLYVPLEFWFCRNVGLALPLIALTSSDVKLTIKFRKLSECYRIGPTHSMEVLEDIVFFEPGDYIEQIVNGQKIYGYFLKFDYIKKKIYYIKIGTRNFESFSENVYDMDYDGIVNQKYPAKIMNANFVKNIPFRIYKSSTKIFCTPKPNSEENSESTDFTPEPQIQNSFLYVDYIYLDKEERKKFMTTNHEYLIEQMQFGQISGVSNNNVKVKLFLKHPCKSMYWVAQLDNFVGLGTINDLYNYTWSPIHNIMYDCDFRRKYENFYGTSLIEKSDLILNGKSFFNITDWTWFNYVKPYQHHYRGPITGINFYSFSIYTEDHQPSSTINMTKIDDINMQIKLNNVVNNLNTAKIRFYTMNYNVLRIYLGRAGMAFE